MLVDDSWMNLIAMENKLLLETQFKLSIESFEFPQQALDHFATSKVPNSQEKIHLIITDYDMPKINGCQLTKKVIFFMLDQRNGR